VHLRINPNTSDDEGDGEPVFRLVRYCRARRQGYMNETVTLQTLLIALAPTGLLLLITLFASVLGGGLEAAGRRLRGHPSRVAELERRVATLETALKRARASELPLEIEAERLAEEIQQLEAEQRDARPTASSATLRPDSTPDSAIQEPAEDSQSEIEEVDQAEQEAPSELEPVLDLPPDPNETEEDRLAREQLEAEERERIEKLAAEEARIRHEREEAERRTRERVEAEAKRRREEQEARDRIERERVEEEDRIERERLEAEAERKREEERVERERLAVEAEERRAEEQRRKAEEFRRRVADATPKIVMSAGGSNREAVTINVAVTNNLTPKRAEIAVLSTGWRQTASPATFETQRKDGLFEERWPKQARDGETPNWGSYEDASGRVFDCPEDPPTDEQAWIVISYERTAGGPASTWQRFEVGGAGALWYIRQPVGDPLVVEASRDESEAAA